MPTFSPTSVADLSERLAQVHREGLTVRVRGRDAGAGSAATSSRPGVGLDISLATLSASIAHVAGDLIATIPAGVTLGAANEFLGRDGQCLPLDPPDADALNIGAVVAANLSGPRRHRYGAPRDLIIGIEMVLADGRIAKAGGRVVKNVAGYDLARLMCGSFGSLGIITSATFKLFPIPAASRTVIIQASDTATLERVVQDISAAPLTPSTIELASPPHQLLIRFETTASAAESQAHAVTRLCDGRGAPGRIAAGADEVAIWREYEQRLWQPAGTLFRISVLPSEVAATIESLAAAASAHGVTWRIGGRAAIGVLHARLEGQEAAHDAVIRTLRSRIAAREGRLVVTRGSGSMPDRWGAMGDTWSLMQSVKAQFDPDGVLNPGGGPGGL